MMIVKALHISTAQIPEDSFNSEWRWQENVWWDIFSWHKNQVCHTFLCHVIIYIILYRESETLKSVGEKTSSALRRTGTAIKDTGTAIKESETMKNVGSKISGAAASLKVCNYVWVLYVAMWRLNVFHYCRKRCGHLQIKLMEVYPMATTQPRVKQLFQMSLLKSSLWVLNPFINVKQRLYSVYPWCLTCSKKKITCCDDALPVTVGRGFLLQVIT